MSRAVALGSIMQMHGVSRKKPTGIGNTHTAQRCEKGLCRVICEGVLEELQAVTVTGE